MFDLFLSYAREDGKFAEGITPVLLRLEHELNITFFRDIECLIPSDQWEPKIDEALQQSSIAICFLSLAYFSSAFIQQRELPRIKRRFEAGSLKIVPVFAGPVAVDSDDTFPNIVWVNKPNQPLCDMSDKELNSFAVDFEKNIRRILEESMIRKPRRIAPNVESTTRYNVVVVGKCGVGKSELVNYLFGKTVRKASIGGPDTGPGFHREDLSILNIPASIWDSAGLEVGYHEQWMRILREELIRRSPTQPIDQWFHTVLYCVQAPGSRIEPFEIEIIQHFLDERYRVIVVITKAYLIKKKLDELAEAIQKQLPKALSFVYVNSKDEETAQGTLYNFGRGDLTKEIEVALIESLIDRVPARCIGIFGQYVDRKCGELVEYVNRYVGVRSKDYISDHIKGELKKLQDAVGLHGVSFIRLYGGKHGTRWRYIRR